MEIISFVAVFGLKRKWGVEVSHLKYKSLNATIPEEKDPTEITMEEELILIEKRIDNDKNKKKGKRKWDNQKIN